MVSSLLAAALLFAPPTETASTEAAPIEVAPTEEAPIEVAPAEAAPAEAAAPAATEAAAAPTETAPTETTTPEKKPKRPKLSPEERLAKVDEARVAMNLGGRVYGRFLTASPAYGGAVQLGIGVRVVRGLYLGGEATVGAHAMPFGAQGQLFLGLRHELRMSKWVRPSYSVGYSHLIDARFSAAVDPLCLCTPHHEFSARSDLRLAQRQGIEAGLGLRFPFKWAPRLSAYLRADVDYYFDQRPGRLQVAGGGGVQVVF